MDFKKRVKQSRLEMNMTLLDVSKKLGVSEATVQRYESGAIKNLKRDTIGKLAEILNVTPQYLFGFDNFQNNTMQNDDTNFDYNKYVKQKNIVPLKLKEVPMLGTIAAGKPILATQKHNYHVSTSSNSKADFCLKVKGDSMINARIYDGDIVFIKSQQTVEDGEIAAVIIDDEATLKRVYKMHGRVQLRSENPNYPPMDFLESDAVNIRIIGKAILSQSPVK